MAMKFSRSFPSAVRRLSLLSSTKSIRSLVIAEHSGTNLLQSTLSTVTAAKKIGGEISLLIVDHSGKLNDSVTEEAKFLDGVSKVFIIQSSQTHTFAENFPQYVSKVIKNDYTHILAPSTNNGKNLLPRLSVLFDSSPLTDVSSVVSPDTFKRQMYAGNAVATIKMSDAVKLLLVRTTAFDKANKGSVAAEVISLTDADLALSSTTQFVSESVAKSDRPELSTARVVVSGGRGMKSGENFKILEQLADKLGGALGASRAAVDSGFVSNEYQVGQTGKVVAPDLYIAVGISGAIQHLTGMKDSKTIVAINKDKDAPIFQVSDYGLVDDLFKVIPEMNSKL